jgi:glyoxylase-like metal-dependent hydrolase (beta-lactamase superfamily II)
VLLRQLKLGPLDNFVYLFGKDGEGFVVDPAYEVEKLLAEARGLGVRLTHVLVTHGHPDHVMGVSRVRKETGAQVVAHESADHPHDLAAVDGATLTLAGMRVRVVHTPGHRFDSVCYVVDEEHLLTGDTIFVDGCGRVDLPGASVPDMWRSLTQTLPALPHALVVLPGHDYGRTPTSTLGREVAQNETMRRRTLAEFEAFMGEP